MERRNIFTLSSDRRDGRTRSNHLQASHHPTTAIDPHKMSVFEAKKLFDSCVKMHTENKINVKNVWNLNVFDYMEILLDSDQMSVNTLQVGSASLDVGSKVYGIRVDNIYADALALASNIARATRNETSYSMPEKRSTLPTGAPVLNTIFRSKYLAPDRKNTIMKDVTNLVKPVSKLDTHVFQTNTNSKYSAVDNMFTSKLPISHCGTKFMILSDAHCFNNENSDDIVLKNSEMVAMPIDKLRLQFPEFSMDFDKFEIEISKDESDELHNTDTDLWSNNEAFPFDDCALPATGFDNSTRENLEETEKKELQLGSDIVFTQPRPSVDFSKDLVDYNMQIGPQSIPEKSPNQNKSPTTKKVSKRLKKDENLSEIDFNRDLPTINYNKRYKRRTTIISNENKYTLPEINLIEDTSFLKQSLMKNIGDLSLNDSNETDDTQKSDVNDTLAENVPDPQELSSPSETINDSDFVGDLENMPDVSNNNTLGYTKYAKRVNMHKLKMLIWKILINDTENLMVSEDIFKKSVRKTTFKHVFDTLPMIANESMREVLSCPLIFLALTHLANERRLKFTGESDHLNFSIESD